PCTAAGQAPCGLCSGLEIAYLDYRRTPSHPRVNPMSVLAALHHLTRYRYDRPINLGPQIVRLCPAPHGRTRVSSYSLKVTPGQHFVNWQHDSNGNRIARFVFPERTNEFS